MPSRNSLKEILPSELTSKTEMTRLTRGFWLSSGTLKISSGSRSPLLSLSIYWKRAYSFWISFSVNWFGNSVLPIFQYLLIILESYFREN